MVFCRRAAESKYLVFHVNTNEVLVYILLYYPHLRNSSQSLVNHKNREAVKKVIQLPAK